MTRALAFPSRLFFYLLFVFLFLPFSAQAGMVLSEIMYDLDGADAGREWVEAENAGAEGVDFSLWKFFEADTNHGLTLYQGEASIPAGGYVVISSDPAKFKTDWPSFTGTIFDSSFSLSNEGELLALKDADLNITDQYTYSSATGARGDGKSLQKIAGSWVVALPTPGAANSPPAVSPSPPLTPPPSGGEGSGSGTSGGVQPGSGGASPAADSKIKVSLSVNSIGSSSGNKIVLAGIPSAFSATAMGHYGERLIHGRFFVNFGDGGSAEIKANEAEKIIHTFFYEGEYVVFLEYYASPYSPRPDASSTLLVKAVKPEVSISRIGSAEDFFVEVSSGTAYALDISGWRVSGNSQSFLFPKNTVLRPNGKILLAPAITGLSITDAGSLTIRDKNDNLIFTYGAKPYSPALPATGVDTGAVGRTVTVTTPLSVSKDEAQVKAEFAPETKEDGIVPEATIPAEDLLARVPDGGEEARGGLPIYVFLLVLLVGAGAGIAYFLRTRGRKPVPGSEFEIEE